MTLGTNPATNPATAAGFLVVAPPGRESGHESGKESGHGCRIPPGHGGASVGIVTNPPPRGARG